MLGIVSGLAREAAIARHISPLVACSAGDPERAAVLARELVAQGATRLMSFGIAGGLAGDLATGRLVVGTGVSTPGRVYACDPALSGKLTSALHGAARGLILASDSIVVSPAEKSRLARRSGAIAVDMESGAVAVAGVPFVVLRAIADPAGSGLPPAALVGLDDEGNPALGPVLRALARAPGQLPALLTTALQARAALRALLGACRDLPPGLAGSP